MRHRAVPLRRLLSEQPEPEPTDDEASFYASLENTHDELPLTVGIYEGEEE